MVYCFAFWAASVLALIMLLLIGAVIVDPDNDFPAPGIIASVVLFFCCCIIFGVNWDCKVIDEYEKRCDNLAKAREYVVTEKYSELKARAYLAPFIEDSVTWYNRIDPSLLGGK